MDNKSSNILPPEAIEEFKKIYKIKFNKELSDEEAAKRANNLFGLYQVVYGNNSRKKILAHY